MTPEQRQQMLDQIDQFLTTQKKEADRDIWWQIVKCMPVRVRYKLLKFVMRLLRIEVATLFERQNRVLGAFLSSKLNYPQIDRDQPKAKKLLNMLSDIEIGLEEKILSEKDIFEA